MKRRDLLTPGKYSSIPHLVLGSRRLSPGAKLVYAVGLDSLGKNESTWPSQAALAIGAGLSIRAVGDRLAELVDAKLIATKRQQHCLVITFLELPTDLKNLPNSTKSRSEESSGQIGSFFRSEQQNLPICHADTYRTEPLKEPLKEPPEENAAVDTSGSRFDQFWNAYPPGRRKADRTACQKKWSALKLDAIADSVLDGLERWKACEEWLKDGGQFIPLAMTWLNKRRWEVELVEPKRETAAEKSARLRAVHNEQRRQTA